MSYVTKAQLIEIVPELRAMVAVEASAEVRAALDRLADQYTAMDGWIPESRTGHYGSRIRSIRPLLSGDR
jgi:hypothetical protein